jgi:hypothetical protein
MLPAALAGLGLVAAAVLVAPAQAGAAPTSGSVGVTSGLVPVFDAEQGVATMAAPAAAATIISRYWTPARIASAVPVPEPKFAATTRHRRDLSAHPRDVAAPTPRP